MSDLTQVLGIVLKVDGTLELANGMKLSSTSTAELAKDLDQLGKAQGAAEGTSRSLDSELVRLAGTERTATTATTALGKGAGEAGKGVTGLNQAVGLTNQTLPRLVDQGNQAAITHQRMTISAQQHAQAMRQLPAQITDVVTSLASGMPVWLVAIQQGGQIKDSFGGIGPAARSLLGLLTPLTLTLGAGAVAGGAFAAAFFQGRAELNAFNREVIITGGYIGYSADQLSTMAMRMGQVAGTRGAAAEALTAIAEGGRIAGTEIERIGVAAVAMNLATGKAIDKTVQEFESLANAPVRAVAELNSRYHFLTASVYQQIVALQAQGQKQAAAELAQKTYADALKSRSDEVTKRLGLIESAWKGIKQAASGAWDSMLDVGRAQTLAQKLDEARARAESARRGQAEGNNIGPYGGPRGTGEERYRSALDKESVLQSEFLLQRRASEQRSVAERDAEKQIEEMQQGHQQALAGLEQAGAAKRLAQTLLNLQERQAVVDAAFRQDETTARAYQASMLAIDKARIDAQETSLQRQISIERAKRPDDPQGVKAQQAAIIQLEAQRLQIQEQRAKLLAEEASGARDIAPKDRSTGASDDLRRFKGTDESNVDQYLVQQKEAREQAARDLVQVNKDMGIALIRDDRARGLAEIAADEEVLRKRLDLNALNAEDRKKVEDDFAQWRVLRERQLTEQLKPEWQRMLDAWADTTKLQRDAYDSAMTGVLRSGEDFWIEFSRTGKINARSMVDGVLVEMARLQYRQNIASPLANFATNLLGNLFGGNYNGNSGGINGGSTILPGDLRGGRAGGGSVTRGGLYEVNENGPELLTQGGKTYLMMGAGDGRVIPNAALGGGGGAPGPVTVNVYNQGQPAKASVQQSRSADGGLRLDVMLDAIDDALGDRIANGQGSTHNALQGRYGLRAAMN